MARVLIPFAQGCEELEAVTLIDLLRRADIEVITASLDDNPVKCSRGTVLLADTLLDTVQNDEFDMIVLPGGLPGADNLQKDERILKLLRRLQQEGKYTAAICAAPKVLVSAGLLENRRATSYPGSLDAEDTSATTVTGNRIEVDGKVATSRGPGTAMDFALELIELLAGKERRDAVETPLCR